MNRGTPDCIYGPVWSRRLGRSLGVDLVPLKTCTYDCIYCQLGPTTCKTVQRQSFVPVNAMSAAVKKALGDGPIPDAITLAGSGEPTLNEDIGVLIEAIKGLTAVPVVVLTNGALLSDPDVQQALMSADLVVPSLDAGDARVFRRVNRPHSAIVFDRMVEGLAMFTARFAKPVWLEVFVLAGITDNADHMGKIAALTRKIRPTRIQLNTVARPPCEQWAKAVPTASLTQWCGLFQPPADIIGSAEHEVRSPDESAGATDSAILGLLGRRPCTVQGVALGLGVHSAEVAKRLDALCRQGRVTIRRQEGALFYILATST